jgi:hypothetical protein
MYDNEYNDDYERITYNINERINKQINPDIYKFNGEITEDHKTKYNNEKNSKIQFSKNKNINFNVYLWDICFASKFGFPNNSMGFNGQWMRKKIAPLANHLSGIDLNQSVHICYRLIEETDENTLDYLCDNISYGNRDFCFKGRKSSGCSEDNIITYNKYIQDIQDEIISNRCTCSFDSFNREYDYMENNPINVICPSYNKFYLNSKDARNNNDDYITISKYEDIDEYLIDINDCSSGFYIGEEDNFDTLQEQWLLLIDKIKKCFDIIGHDKPFWTAYLPENIEKFEEVRVLTNCGNFIDIIARSKKYFYFMQLAK